MSYVGPLIISILLALTVTALLLVPPFKLTTDQQSGVIFFAGLTDDPFFFDIPAFGRFNASIRAGAPNPDVFSRGRDTFAGYNTMAIAFSLPISLVRGNSNQIGAIIETQRRTPQFYNSRTGEVTGAGRWTNVDRMGIPALNVVLVPFNQKNSHDAGSTVDDFNRRFWPGILETLQNFYHTHATSIAVFQDLVVRRGDFLRVDLTIPNNGTNSEAQFPNGRRLTDDVVDILNFLINNRQPLNSASIATQSRLARLDLIRGDTVSARRRFDYVLAHSRTARLSSTETIAWCHWQLGELEMAQGRYQQAERQYRLSLGAVKDYSHAIASLARLRAGQGDLQGAIESLEKARSRKTDPVDAATLGDLYKLAGKDVAATEQFSSVERASEQNPLHSILYRRHLILFWADHDRMTDKAYELARKEYEIRRDIYGADALAWAALKAGKIEEARSVIKEALRLGTQDARLFYHAGMIARAAGDRMAAADFLRRAVKLNRLFDPWHSRIATEALKEESIVAAR